MFASHARQAAARQAAAQTAGQAKNEAGEAFVALDETQKSITLFVEAFARLDAGPVGQRVLAELAPLTAAGDAAAQGWIDTLDAHGRSLDDEEADPRALQAAEQAFRAVRGALDGARTHLLAFQARHRDIETRMQAAFAQLAPRTQAARAALDGARRAVADAAAAGLRSDDLDARLARAEELGSLVAEGAQRHGAAATLRACDQAQEAAEQATTAARALRDLAVDTPRRLGTTRTRSDGVAARLEQLPPTLSTLRRRFSMACSRDLDHLPQEAAAEMTQARELLARAAVAGEQGRWPDAATSLNRCREHLATAEAGVNQVVQRLRDLEAVAADPAQEKSRARFAVRDAQTLVVAAGTRVSPNEATILDSLAARLDHVDEKLTTAAHPDYWGYLVELRAVTDLTASVVRRTRAAMGQPR